MTPVNISKDLQIIDAEIDKYFVIITFTIKYNYIRERFMVYYDDTYSRCKIDFELPTQDQLLIKYTEMTLDENKEKINEYLENLRLNEFW